MKNKEINEIRDALVRSGILESCGCCYTTKYSDIVKKVDLLSKEYLNSEIRTFNDKTTEASSCSIPFLFHAVLKKIVYTINVVNTRANDVDYIRACLKAIKIEMLELQTKVLPARELSMPVEETREMLWK